MNEQFTYSKASNRTVAYLLNLIVILALVGFILQLPFSILYLAAALILMFFMAFYDTRLNVRDAHFKLTDDGLTITLAKSVLNLPFDQISGLRKHNFYQRKSGLVFFRNKKVNLAYSIDLNNGQSFQFCVPRSEINALLVDSDKPLPYSLSKCMDALSKRIKKPIQVDA